MHTTHTHTTMDRSTYSAAGFEGVSLVEATIMKHRQAQAARQEAKRRVGEFDTARKQQASALLKQQGRSWFGASWEEKLAACVEVPDAHAHAHETLVERIKRAARKAAWARATAGPARRDSWSRPIKTRPTPAAAQRKPPSKLDRIQHDEAPPVKPMPKADPLIWGSPPPVVVPPVGSQRQSGRKEKITNEALEACITVKPQEEWTHEDWMRQRREILEKISADEPPGGYTLRTLPAGEIDRAENSENYFHGWERCHISEHGW